MHAVCDCALWLCAEGTHRGAKVPPKCRKMSKLANLNADARYVLSECPCCLYSHTLGYRDTTVLPVQCALLLT